MKVLFVAPSHPYVRDGGAALRLRPFVEAVVSSGQAHLLCLGPRTDVVTAGAAPFAYAETAALNPPGAAKRLARSLLLSCPDLALRSRSRRAAIALHRLLIQERYDAIHLAGLQMAYLEGVIWSTVLTSRGEAPEGSCRPALILDELNAEYEVHRRLAAIGGVFASPLETAVSLVQYLLLRPYERAAIGGADAVTCPAESDSILLRALGAPAPIHVVPSGLNVDRYRRLPSPPDEPVALFVADFSYRPNRQAARWLLERVAPLVCQSVPAARFVLVGGGPVPPVRGVPSSRFEFTGYVDDVLPHLARAKVVLAPLLAGGGLKLKVVEGMAAGRPVVATSVGAEGVGAENGREIAVADGAVAFAGALAGLLSDTARAVRMGEAARRHASARFDGAVVGARYLEVVESACRRLSR